MRASPATRPEVLVSDSETQDETDEEPERPPTAGKASAPVGARPGLETGLARPSVARNAAGGAGPGLAPGQVRPPAATDAAAAAAGPGRPAAAASSQPDSQAGALDNLFQLLGDGQQPDAVKGLLERNTALAEQSAQQMQLLQTQQQQMHAQQQLMQTQQEQLRQLMDDQATGRGSAKRKIPRPKTAQKLLHTHDNILLDARTKWEGATSDEKKLTEIIEAFDARTAEPTKREPKIPDRWRVTLPKLTCLDMETLTAKRLGQDTFFRVVQLSQLKAVLDCIKKDVEIKLANIAQVRVTLAEKLDVILLDPVRDTADLLEIATQHKTEVLADFDAIGRRSLLEARQLQAGRLAAQNEKRAVDVKVKEKADLAELNGELDRTALLMEITRLRAEKDDSAAPPGEDRMSKIQEEIDACQKSIQALNKLARKKPKSERAAPGKKLTLKEKKKKAKAAKAKAAAKAAAKTQTSSSATPGGGKGKTKGKGKGKGNSKGKGKGRGSAPGGGTGRGSTAPKSNKRKAGATQQGKPAKKPRP